MKALTSLSITFMLFVAAACSEGTSRPSYLFKPAKEGVAAQVGDMTITNQELNSGIESELFDAEMKVFELKFGRLKSILIERYMEKDPKKKGLSNDEYMDKYIAAGIKISEKDVDNFIKEQNIPAEHINPQVREKIKNYISMEKKKVAVESWLAEQTKKTPVEVFIQKPRRPTFDVQVGNAPSAGAADAKVKIVEFSDFQCPFCAKGAEILTQLKKKYGNKIQVAFKNFPLPFHNHAEKAAIAGLCANEFGAEYFWKMHDEMFAHQDQLAVAGLKKTASKIGIKKLDQFNACLDGDKYKEQVARDMAEGRALNVKSTPTFFINGQLINGAQSIDVFSEIVDEELAR